MVRSDCDDRHFLNAGTVAPEDTIGRRRAVLSIGHKNLLISIERVRAGDEDVRPQAGMTWILSQERKTFVNLLEETLVIAGFSHIGSISRRIRDRTKLSILPRCFGCPPDGEASAHSPMRPTNNLSPSKSGG